MKNPTLAIQSSKRFDKIISEEVYPAIMKAYAVLNSDTDHSIKNALLITSTEHLTNCLANLCELNKNMYLSETKSRNQDEDIETLRDYLITR